MRFHTPLQIKDGPNAGRWHFCQQDRYGAIAIGYCAQYRSCKACDAAHAFPANPNCSECGGKGLIPLELPCAGHATQDEARAHYREYQLNERLRLIDPPTDPDEWRRCQAANCRAPTAGRAQIGVYYQWWLCDEHRNKDTVAQLFMAAGDFYES